MRKGLNFILSCFLLLGTTVSAQNDSLTRIAFGSCGHQQHPLPILYLAASHSPDIFVFLGDNIYGDTRDMNVLEEKYALLGAKPSYQKLKESTKIVATWDDHDFGENDAGKEYPFKEESKELFLDFFEEPDNSQRRKHSGIYTSYMLQEGDKTIQLILLDNRTFRDPLKPYTNEVENDRRFFYQPYYGKHTDGTSSFLGEEQWKWLEGELQKPADLRIIGSGSQFGIEYNTYESWANYPHEQTRMLNLINDNKVDGVLFISGDVHYAEISAIHTDKIYPIYDVTSSGLSSTWHFATPNINRIEGPVMENHFGLITVDWKPQDPKIKMEIWDDLNNQRIEYTVPLSHISF